MTNPDPTLFETDESFDTDPAFGEFELLRRQRKDMFAMLFDPDSVPKEPDGVEEPQSERGGTTDVDIISDHTPVEDELGMFDDELDVGLDELEVEE